MYNNNKVESSQITPRESLSNCVKPVRADFLEVHSNKLQKKTWLCFMQTKRCRPAYASKQSILFSVMLEQVFLGWASTEQGFVSCSRTQLCAAGKAWTHNPLILSQALYHWATALPLLGFHSMVSIAASRDKTQERRHGISNIVAFWQMYAQMSLCSLLLSLETPNGWLVGFVALRPKSEKKTPNGVQSVA